MFGISTIRAKVAAAVAALFALLERCSTPKEMKQLRRRAAEIRFDVEGR